MLLSNEKRPFFCLRALPHEEKGVATNMMNVAYSLDRALHEPWRTYEFEDAAECVLRNNGFDPNHDLGWKKAGIEDGRVGAVRQIKQAYLAAVPDGLKHLASDAKTNPYDYTPSALSEQNILEGVVSSLQRAHYGKDVGFLATDEAWQEAGIANIQELQNTVRDIFVEAKVGGYVAHQLNMTDDSRTDALSVKVADYAIQKTFPALATKLGIPANIREELVPIPSAAASAFGQARDYYPG